MCPARAIASATSAAVKTNKLDRRVQAKVLRFNLWSGEQLLGTTNPNTQKPFAVLTDDNKNVIALLDQHGRIAAKYTYSPFGKLLSAQGANVEECSFRFSSEYLDTESGLVYYNYRYYSPQLGRWLSRDSIEEGGGYNLYSMLWNRVPNVCDLLGLAGPITHGTRKCSEDDSCNVLVVKIHAWIRHYTTRYNELMIDKYDYKKRSPVKYNNHIVQAAQAATNTVKCITILIGKINRCECGDNPPKVPVFAPKKLPSPVPVPPTPMTLPTPDQRCLGLWDFGQDWGLALRRHLLSLEQSLKILQLVVQALQMTQYHFGRRQECL